MSAELTEEEMRLALFGPASEPAPLPPKEPEPVFQMPEPTPEPTPKPQIETAPPPKPKPRSVAKSTSPRLRVTLHVTKEYEGAVEVFVHDANTLSTFTAEQEAKSEAKKKKFKYFDVVSIKPI
jgi:hypothetical protein